jgi:hypothetical protein
MKTTARKAKHYRAHGCKVNNCTFIENFAGWEEMFSNVPVNALLWTN